MTLSHHRRRAIDRERLDEKLALAAAERERRADVVLAFDDAVTGAVARLKERGFDSAYLRNFVVARVNPLRFVRGEPPAFDALFTQMTRRAAGMDPSKVKNDDVARSGGAPDPE